MPSEGVTLPRIGVNCCVWFAGKCRLDLSLRRLGNELILLGQMHKQRGMEAVEFAKLFLGVTAVRGACSVGAVAHGSQEGHQAAEAVAEDRNLTAAIGQFSHNVNGVLNVPGARVSVIGLIKAKT